MIQTAHFYVPERFEGEETDSPAIRRVLDRIKDCGGTIFFPKSEYWIDEPIVIYRDCRYEGRGVGQTTSYVKKGANCDAFVTEHFEEFCGQKKYGDDVDQNYGPSSRMPQNFSLSKFTVDCGADFEETEEEHVFRCTGNTAGNGIRIFGKRYTVSEVQIQNVPQIGFYSEFNSGEVVTPANSFRYFIGSKICVRVISSGEEGFVYRGPSDQRIDDLWVCSSCLTGKTTLYRDYPDWELASTIFEDKDPINGKKTYCASPELGFAHIWRGFRCWGMLVIGQLRFKADHLIIESTNGGLRNSSATYSQINQLDIHDCRFGDEKRPYLHLRSKAHTKISNLEIRYSRESSHKDMVVIDGDNTVISECLLRGNSDIIGREKSGGNGLVINGNCNQILALHGMNIAGDAAESNACVIRGSHNIVRGIVRDCDVGVRVENAMNTVDITCRRSEGQAALSGDMLAGADVSCRDYCATDNRFSEFPCGISREKLFRADTEAAQTVSVPINVPWRLSYRNVQATLINPESLTDFSLDYLTVDWVERENIVLSLRLSKGSAVKDSYLGVALRLSGRAEEGV